MVDKFVKVFCVIFLWSYFGADVVSLFVLEHCDITISLCWYAFQSLPSLYFFHNLSLPHMMWHCALISLLYQGWILFLVDITSLIGAISSRACSTAVLNESIALDSDWDSSILSVLKCFEKSTTVMEAVGLVYILLVLTNPLLIPANSQIKFLILNTPCIRSLKIP